MHPVFYQKVGLSAKVWSLKLLCQQHSLWSNDWNAFYARTLGRVEAIYLTPGLNVPTDIIYFKIYFSH